MFLSILILFFFLTVTGPAAGDEATSITISCELSVSETYPGYDLWINGTAEYDNGTPVMDSDVLVGYADNAMEWRIKTDADGNYHTQMAAVGRFVDQNQSLALVPSGYTDMIRSGTRVGQSFTPTVSEIQSIDIYLVKNSPDPTSSFTLYVKPHQNLTELGNSTLKYEEIIDGWNNFVFQQPLAVIPGFEYFMLLTSNTTSGGYRNYGGIWSDTWDYYENGTVFWELGPYLEPSPYQDIGFFTYYDAPLVPSEYQINVSITGANTTQALFGTNTTTLSIVPEPVADAYLSSENITLSHEHDPPLEGDSVIVNVTVVNLGDKELSSCVVNFSIDIESNVFDSQVITVPPFGFEVMSSIWTAEAGNHTIIVVADAPDLLFESLETNNNVSVNIFSDGDNDGDMIGNLTDIDDDNDGYTDAMEAFYKTDPLSDLSTPPDNDLDLLPDSHDSDDDNDGYDDIIEDLVGTDPKSNASVPDDFDSDGTPDSLDMDMDNDGILNDEDVFPFNVEDWLDLDRDGIGDNADPDDDSDGYPDDLDDHPRDTDNDGLDNDVDWDDDADGIPDSEDTRSLDTDNDGLNNDLDRDDDGDGLTDDEEASKSTNPLKQDTDGDGVNDKADFDPLDSEVTSEEDPQWIYIIVPVIVVLLVVLLALLSSRGLSRRKSRTSGEEYEELPDVDDGYGIPTEEEPVTGDALSPGTGVEGAQLSETTEAPDDELADIEEEYEELSSKSDAAEKKQQEPPPAE
jgi:hypothetical protein